MVPVVREPSIKRVPKMHGVYWIDFCGHGSPSLICRYFDDRGTWRMVHLTEYGGNEFTLRQCLANCKAVHQIANPMALCFEEPVPVIEPAPGVRETGDYQLIMLAPGAYVAFSDYFVAMYNRRFNEWFVKWVAMEPQKYFEVKIGDGKALRVRLAWDGKGISYADVVSKRTQIPTGANVKRPMIPCRNVANVNQITELWMQDTGLGAETLLAATPHHVFGFFEQEGDWTWSLLSCDACDTLDECHLHNVGLEIRQNPWQMLIKEWGQYV